jgi:hypothetical protein
MRNPWDSRLVQREKRERYHWGKFGSILWRGDSLLMRFSLRSEFEVDEMKRAAAPRKPQ